MDSKYLVIDVETSNEHNDTLCQIGMVYLNDKLEVVKEKPQLINPESDFGIINMKIHHITPDMVIDKPKFNEFWNEIKNDFYNNIIVCHNKSTDLVVIDKHLKKYGINFLEEKIRYIDTLEICRCSCCFESNKLERVCNELSLKVVEAHNAQNDAYMCSELLKYFINNDYQIDIHEYEGFGTYSNSERRRTNSNRNFSEMTICLRDLNEYLKMISNDDRITESELLPICDWLVTNSQLKGHFQYDEIYDLVEKVFADKVIDENENIYLCKKIMEIVNPVKSNSIFVPNDYPIEFKDKKFVITGEFSCGKTRNQIENIIISKGGKVTKKVSGKTDYLIVGNQGSEFWSQGNYGSKIQDAIDLKINIIKEDTFLNCTRE